MKISIELTSAEVAGIKKYLQEVDGIEKVTQLYLKGFIQQIVSGTINAPQEAVSDYIKNEQS